jgi:glycerophosphoryl diester phosphodiesterase
VTTPSAGGSSTRRPILSLGALLLATTMLAACGGDDSNAPEADEPDEALASAGYDLQGHRGARGLRPENTLPAFEAALDLEVDTLEMDLHFTADEIVVVWHDPVIDGDKCGLDPAAAVAAPDPDDPGTPEDALRISSLSAAQLAAYRCDRNPDSGRFPEQRAEAGQLAVEDYYIPTLDEVFAFVAAYAGSELKSDTQRANAATVEFNIETKRNPEDPSGIGDGFDGEAAGPFEQGLLAAVDRAQTHDRTIVQSFDHRSLWAIRDIDADIRLAALTRRDVIPDFAQLVLEGATIWSPDWRSVDADTLGSAHAAGLAVIPWTVNDPAEMQQLIDLGVDGIITDRPDLAPDR